MNIFSTLNLRLSLIDYKTTKTNTQVHNNYHIYIMPGASVALRLKLLFQIQASCTIDELD